MKFSFAILGLIPALFALAGCNLFNPSGGSSLAKNNTDELIAEGQKKFRDAEYEASAKKFSEALKRDSTKSEAWFGLAKANLYKNDGDPFDLLSNYDFDADIPLWDLDSSDAVRFCNAIESALEPLRELVRRDTLTAQNPKLALTDRIVIYSNFSASYVLLEFAYTILYVRTELASLLKGLEDEILDDDNAFGSSGTAEFYDNLLNDSTLAGELNALIDSMSSDIRNATDLVGSISGNLLENTVFLDSTTEALQKELPFYKFGDGIDNDGDGCVDEEIYDGIDNDGDGLIDEDLRIVPILRDADSVITFIGIAKDSLDHDLNGFKEDSLERTLDSIGRFLFAVDFPKISSKDSSFAELRKKIAADTDSNNILYPLSARKALVGRCWNNYTEEDFCAWFRNR